MAMNYYTKTIPSSVSMLECNGCGAVLAYYRAPAPRFYGF